VLETPSRGRSQALFYNSVRPHASLGFRPPAPEVILPTFAAWPAVLRRPAPPTLHTMAPKPMLN
jgi:putative transposase